MCVMTRPLLHALYGSSHRHDATGAELPEGGHDSSWATEIQEKRSLSPVLPTALPYRQRFTTFRLDRSPFGEGKLGGVGGCLRLQATPCATAALPHGRHWRLSQEPCPLQVGASKRCSAGLGLLRIECLQAVTSRIFFFLVCFYFATLTRILASAACVILLDPI